MYEMEDLYINTCRYSSRNNASLPVVCGWNIDILLPVISKMPGFVLYTLGSMSPDGHLAISVYRSESGLQAFRQTMADFISEFYTQDPLQMTSGKLDALVLPNTDADARCSKPHYFSYRRYAAIAPDIARKSERLVHASLMPFMTDQTASECTPCWPRMMACGQVSTSRSAKKRSWPLKKAAQRSAAAPGPRRR